MGSCLFSVLHPAGDTRMPPRTNLAWAIHRHSEHVVHVPIKDYHFELYEHKHHLKLDGTCKRVHTSACAHTDSLTHTTLHTHCHTHTVTHTTSRHIYTLIRKIMHINLHNLQVSNMWHIASLRACVRLFLVTGYTSNMQTGMLASQGAQGEAYT